MATAETTTPDISSDPHVDGWMRLCLAWLQSLETSSRGTILGLQSEQSHLLLDIRDHKIIDTHEQPLLEVKHVSLHSKVKDASFSLLRGEVLVLTGLVGAWRSEFL